MNLLRRAILQGLGGINVADMFSIDLFSNNTTVTSGIDADLVWIKSRGFIDNHLLFDKERGVNQALSSNTRNPQSTFNNSLTAFNLNGYDVGSAVTTNNVGWSFKKSPRFFDIIKYTGDGVGGREIPHSLGVEAGLVIVKSIPNSRNWYVQHRSLPPTEYLRLDLEAGSLTVSTVWNNTAANDTTVTLGIADEVNGVGEEYIMYVFAHDIADDGLIQCGSYTGDNTNPVTVVTGFPVAWVMIKTSSAASGWWMLDAPRNEASSSSSLLSANATSLEASLPGITFNSDGFTVSGSFTQGSFNHLFIAIADPTIV